MSTETYDTGFNTSTAASLQSLTPWDTLSSRQLAALLRVSIQVLANWRMRDTGPKPAPANCFRGNRTYYPVYEVEAWLCGIEPWEVMRDWLRERYIFPEPLTTAERTWKVACRLQRWQIHPLTHKPKRHIPMPA